MSRLHDSLTRREYKNSGWKEHALYLQHGSAHGRAFIGKLLGLLEIKTPDKMSCRGFQLLSKMGYKAGEGIGKDGRGRAAPISVDLKAGRTGLGVDEEKKRKQHSYKHLQELRSKRHWRPCASLCMRAAVLPWRSLDRTKTKCRCK